MEPGTLKGELSHTAKQTPNRRTDHSRRKGEFVLAQKTR